MFVLGTANFGHIYAGSKIVIDVKRASELVHQFIEAGGKKLDTAEAYGNSIKIIEQLDELEFQLGSKFSSEFMMNEDTFSAYLKNLQIKFGYKLSYLLLHDVKSVARLPESSINILKNFLIENQNVKFGISIYYVEDLNLAIEYFDFISIVQAPLNYFDRRFISKSFKKLCESQKIELNYRSIFLQGKILQKFNNLNPYFQRFDQFNYYYSDFARSKCTSLLEFNIEFVKLVANFSNIVLGVENVAQMSEIFNLLNQSKCKIDENQISQIDFNEQLCIPMNWKLI